MLSRVGLQSATLAKSLETLGGILLNWRFWVSVTDLTTCRNNYIRHNNQLLDQVEIIPFANYNFPVAEIIRIKDTDKSVFLQG